MTTSETNLEMDWHKEMSDTHWPSMHLKSPGAQEVVGGHMTKALANDPSGQVMYPSGADFISAALEQCNGDLTHEPSEHLMGKSVGQML